MSDATTPPAHDIERDPPDDASVQERVDLDPHEQPNAPNRPPETEYVGPGGTGDSTSSGVSDDDELDRPDNADLP
jgi:hypothetical protein